MKIKKISVLIFLALFGAVLNGQVRQPHSLYFMETIPQISQMNPALQPRANGYVMIPSVNIDLLSDLALKDLLQKQGKQWHSPIENNYDYAELRKSIGKKATKFIGGADVEIGFGFRMGSSYFSFGLSEHVYGNFALPSDLFKITENGFPDKTKLDFSPTRTQGLAYMQFLFGYSSKVTDKLTVGINVKPLFGQLAVATKIDKFKLHTGELQWDGDAKGNIYSSAPIDITMKKDDNDKIEEIKFRDLSDYEFPDWMNNYFTGFYNPGIAFDLGASYQIDKQLTVSASLNNLGFISWKNELNSISFDGNYKFNGVYFDVSSDDKIKDLFKNLGDSIADAMNYTVKHDKFKTPLAPVFHAGASYQFTDAVSVGLLSRSVFWKNGIRQSFNTSVCLQPYSFAAVNVGATWQVKGNVYLGGGFMFLLGPLQFYLLVDNVPIFYSTLKIDDYQKISYLPERLKSFTMHLGLNLVFGRHGYVNKPMLDNGRNSW